MNQTKNDYEVYRMTTLGVALEETLDDMIQVFKHVPNLYSLVFNYFMLIIFFSLQRTAY